MKLESKVAFVTGASGGIGKACALVLAGYGADIVAVDIMEDGIKETVREAERLGRKGLAVATDISKSEQVDNAVDLAIKKFGTIDILVNSAGVQPMAKFSDMSEEVWNRNMDINAKGTFLCCRAVSNVMKKNASGKIINVSSQASKIGEVGNGAYGCSKAAVNILTQVLALELAPYHINVNAICPGLIDTKLLDRAFIQHGRENNIDPEAFKKTWLDRIPLKRLGKTEEVGELVAFLASDKSDYITGVAITIAGGTTLI